MLRGYTYMAQSRYVARIPVRTRRGYVFSAERKEIARALEGNSGRSQGVDGVKSSVRAWRHMLRKREIIQLRLGGPKVATHPSFPCSCVLPST